MNRTEAQQTAATVTPGGTHVNDANALRIADQKNSQALSLPAEAMARHNTLSHPAAASIMAEWSAAATGRLTPLLRVISGTCSLITAFVASTARGLEGANEVKRPAAAMGEHGPDVGEQGTA